MPDILIFRYPFECSRKIKYSTSRKYLRRNTSEVNALLLIVQNNNDCLPRQGQDLLIHSKGHICEGWLPKLRISNKTKDNRLSYFVFSCFKGGRYRWALLNSVPVLGGSKPCTNVQLIPSDLFSLFSRVFSASFIILIVRKNKRSQPT